MQIYEVRISHGALLDMNGLRVFENEIVIVDRIIPSKMNEG